MTPEAKMTRQSGTPKKLPILTQKLRNSAVFAAALCAITLASPTPASAQAVDGVVVDLSVLTDGGVGGASTSPLSGGKLALPPRTTVRSKLYVPPRKKVGASRPAVRAARAATPKSAPTPNSKKPAMPAAPAPKQKMAATPKPAMAPPQPITKPAPKPKVKTVAAPPPPKPAKPAKPAAKPAMKMADKAPPPPPPSNAPPPMPKTSAAPPPPAAPAGSTGAESAAAPADIVIKPGRALRIAFDAAETKLPANAESGLNALANAMRTDKDYRLQLMAYAGAADLTTSKARRISLSRALAVRSFLIDKGVRSTQIDVRALGNKTAEKPLNRVDVNLAKR